MTNYVLNFTSTNNSPPIKGKSSIVVQPMKTDGPASPTDNNALNGGTYSASYASTSLLIYGKGVPDYGSRIQENVLHLLENHAGINPPAHPTIGQLWYYYNSAAVASNVLKLCVDVTVDGNDKSTGATWVDLPQGATTIDGFVFSPPLILSADPTNNLGAVTKQYVDNSAAGLTGAKVNRSGDTMTGALALVGDPTNALDASTKQYVDTKLSLAGGTLTGTLILSANPINPFDASPKQYVDQTSTTAANLATSTKLSKSGDTMTGALTLVGDPVGTLDAATKQYVDTKLSLAGGVLLGRLQLVGDPIDPLEPSTKQYVDNLIATIVVPNSDSVISGYMDVGNNTLVLNKSQGHPDVVITNVSPAQHYHTSLEVTMDVSINAGSPLNLTYATAPNYPVIGLTDIINNLDTTKAAITYVDTKTAIVRSIVTSTGAAGYTTPPYVVGSNRLWVFVNGVKHYEGTSDDYTEDGVVGAISTSITFIANIPPSGLPNRIEFLVVGS